MPFRKIALRQINFDFREGMAFGKASVNSPYKMADAKSLQILIQRLFIISHAVPMHSLNRVVRLQSANYSMGNLY
jgi:hypothetical protein